MSEIELVLLLLAIVIVLTAASRRLGMSTPIAMVVGGLALSFVPFIPEVALSPDLVFLGFLPPLLFAGGYFTSLRDFRANLRPIVLLALGLVLFTAAVVALVAHTLVPALGWAGAFALGGIVAPPDAIAATAIFQRLGVPRKIVTVLEGESLVNDATALVIYRFAVAAASAGAFSLLDASGAFVVVLAGGIAVGVAVGLALDFLASRITDTPVLVAVSLVAPYVAYLPAESLGVSGVLAAVAGGLFARHAMRHASSDARVVASGVWQMWLFLLNGLVFVLLGLQLRAVLAAVDLGTSTIATAASVVLAVALARFAWVFPITYVPGLTHPRGAPAPQWRGVVVVAWSGLRGVVSLAAALALPAGFPQRDLILFLTFTVIIATLVGQGLTLTPLIRLLGLAPDDDTAHAEAHARALTAEVALARVDELAAEWPGHRDLIDRLRAQYEHRTAHAELHHSDEPEAAEREVIEHTQIRRELIEAERAAAFDLHGRGVIGDALLRKIERELDLEELRMEA